MAKMQDIGENSKTCSELGNEKQTFSNYQYNESLIQHNLRPNSFLIVKDDLILNVE